MNKKEWKIFIDLLRPFKKDFTVLVFLLIGLGVVDASLPYATKVAIDRFIVPRTTDGLGLFLFIYGTGIFTLASFVTIFIIQAGKLETKLSYHLRKESFEKMQDFRFEYFHSEGVGKILSKITSDIGKVSDILAWSAVDLVWGLVFMGTILTILFFNSVKLTLVALAVIPFLIISSYFFQKGIYKVQKAVRRMNSEIIRLINEGVSGVITSKTLVTEKRNVDEFMEKTLDMKKMSMRSATISNLYFPVAVLLSNIGIAMVIVYGGIKLDTGEISLGLLLAFINYTMLLFEPIKQMANSISNLQSAKAAMQRIVGHVSNEKDLEVINPVDIGDIRGHIEFKNVDFSYDSREVVLKDFSLDVKPGEKIALVGETGAGKSTIVNLVCKFYAPTEGDIILDGTNYSSIRREDIQSRLGYVLQTPHLFSGTIMENIRYGRLNASDDEVIEAARLAQANDFIEELEGGFNYSVGEGGNKLSSGEKQLISIARAILADPRIFVLDEATSSVDIETESRIQKAIENVLADRTSFIIAHRLSTVKFVDRIVYIDGGRIVEMGSHSELLSRKGRYWQLYNNQFIDI